MADTDVAAGTGLISGMDQLRATSIVVYGLYIAAAVTALPAVLGVMLAYAKRHEARGTVFESHFDHAIELFWIALVGSVVMLPLAFLFGLGVVLAGALLVWLVSRSVKGLNCALRGAPSG